MLKDLKEQLERKGFLVDAPVERPGITALLPDAQVSVAGGDYFIQYHQNTGDPGPHPGPFWQDVVFREVEPIAPD